MKITKLSSGLTVASEHIPHVRTVTIGFWVKCGTFCEAESERGLSHFLEHMFFKGSRSRTARDIVEAFDDVGGELNAYTTKEYTCFYAKVIDEHLPIAVDVLADMLSHPLLSDSDVEREKQIVLEEIALYEDTPDELIHDYIASTVWPEHPLGLPILGTRESINAIDHKIVESFYKRHYIPQSIVVAAAGNVDHDKLMELVERHLTLECRDSCAIPVMPEVVYAERINIVERATEQLHLCLGFPGLSFRDSNIYTLNMLNNIFGAGMSSRLFQGVREELGLAYSIYSYSASFSSAGYYAIYAGLSTKNAETLLSTVAKEAARMRTELVTPAELNRAKQQVKGGLVMGLESTANRMSRMGRGLLLLGKVTDAEEIVRKIESVTAEQVQQLAGTILEPNHASLCALGPPADLPKLGPILRNSF